MTSATQKVTVFIQQRLLIARERGGKLESNADARHLQNGGGLIFAVRVDHRNGLRQIGLALVVVGDDKIHAKRAAELGFLVGGDAAVDRDDELHILRVQRTHGNFIEPVALLQPRRDIACHMAAALAQKFCQQARGRDAVDIIVAEYADMLAPLQRLFDARGGLVHVEQGKGT